MLDRRSFLLVSPLAQSSSESKALSLRSQDTVVFGH